MTHDLLEDLVRDVPRHVVPDIPGAWRVGARRFRQRRVAVSALGLGLVLMLGLAVVGFDPGSDVEPADGGVGGYPAQIPMPLFLTDLPDRPGPMAAVMESTQGWVAVDDAGRSWRIPDVSRYSDSHPTLSDDGGLLGYLRETSETRSEYVVLDLVEGGSTSYPDIGDGTLDEGGDPRARQTFYENGQSPGFWSPDGKWLSIYGTSHEDPRPGPLLLGPDGQIRVLGVGTWPVGWLGANRLVMIQANGRLKTVSTSGKVVSQVTLSVPDGFELFGQWAGRLSPDGSTVAIGLDRVSNETMYGPTYAVATFDVATGQLIRDFGLGAVQESCLLAWQGDRVLGWVYESGLEDLDSGEVVITPSSRWDEAGCLMAAAKSLNGERSPGPGLVEWRYWGWLWEWKKLLGALLVSAFVGGIIFLDRRARRRQG